MDEYTVQDAARLLHVSEKTVYRWIEQKKLTARKYGIQHFISRQEVEALAKSRPVHLGDDHTRLDILEQYNKTLSALFDAHDFRIRALEQRLVNLEMEVQSLRQQPAQPLYRFKVDAEDAHKGQPTQGRAQSVKSTIPDGYVLVRHFNELHGMSDTSIHRRVNEGIIEVTRGEWQVGRTRVTQLLSPAQQWLYWQVLHDYAGFVRCKDCPHEE